MSLFKITNKSCLAAAGLAIALLSGCASQSSHTTFEQPSANQQASRLSLLSFAKKSPIVPPTAVEPEVAREPAVDARDAVSNDILFSAMQLSGTKYRFGGSSPETGFDCSGLIQYVYNKTIGVMLPRTVREMNKMDAQSVAKSDLKPGDLVIFQARKKYPDHAGIYVGEGRFLHAPSSGGRVRIDELSNSYWARSYLGAKRVVTEERASMVLAQNDQSSTR